MNRINRAYCLLLALTGGILLAERSDLGQRRIVEARDIGNERIRLDGILDEAVWETVEPATGFIQEAPEEGEPSTENSEVYILYDKHNLYIGAILYDSDPSGILAYQKRRDASLRTDDRFMWILDTFLDGRTGYFFEINPAGLMGDGILGAGGWWNINKSWDGIWDARVQITSTFNGQSGGRTRTSAGLASRETRT